MAGSSTWSTGVDTTESLLPFRHGDLAERAELKEEILNLIRPHRDADVKPPFSGTGMATMALICCDNLTMKESQVLNWIISTFVFYSRKLIDAHSKAAVLDGPGGSDDPYHPFGCVVDNFWEILTDYEAPFLTKTKDRKVYGDYPTTLLSADHRASRIFFSKYLAPERKGVFPFLELPAEMRNTIYELCFQLPRAGVMVERERRFFASDRHPFMLEDVEENCSTDWPVSKDKDPEELFAIDTSKLLSLLLTCKQIHKEAEAILFAINDFYIRDITRFYEISVLLSHSRFHNMQSLFLNFTNFYQDRRDFAHWISVTEMLAARPKPLKLFILQMQDSDWTEMSPDN